MIVTIVIISLVSAAVTIICVALCYRASGTHTTSTYMPLLEGEQSDVVVQRLDRATMMENGIRDEPIAIQLFHKSMLESAGVSVIPDQKLRTLVVGKITINCRFDAVICNMDDCVTDLRSDDCVTDLRSDDCVTDLRSDDKHIVGIAEIKCRQYKIFGLPTMTKKRRDIVQLACYYKAMPNLTRYYIVEFFNGAIHPVEVPIPLLDSTWREIRNKLNVQYPAGIVLNASDVFNHIVVRL